MKATVCVYFIFIIILLANIGINIPWKSPGSQQHNLIKNQTINKLIAWLSNNEMDLFDQHCGQSWGIGSKWHHQPKTVKQVDQLQYFCVLMAYIAREKETKSSINSIREFCLLWDWKLEAKVSLGPVWQRCGEMFPCSRGLLTWQWNVFGRCILAISKIIQTERFVELLPVSADFSKRLKFVSQVSPYSTTSFLMQI